MAKKNALQAVLALLRKEYPFTVQVGTDRDFIYFTDSNVVIRDSNTGRGSVTLQLGNMVRHHRIPTYILASLNAMRGIEAQLRIPSDLNPGTRREDMLRTYLDAIRAIPGYEKVKGKIDHKRNPDKDIVLDFTYDNHALFRIDVGLFSSDLARTCGMGAECATFFCNNWSTEFRTLEELVKLLTQEVPQRRELDIQYDKNSVCFLADSRFAETFIWLTARGYRNFKAHKVVVEARTKTNQTVIKKFLDSNTEHTVYVGEGTNDF